MEDSVDKWMRYIGKVMNVVGIVAIAGFVWIVVVLLSQRV
jgi:hypothetical protein